ncbi:cytochrome d ubiquinol oxidase subunit II [Prosthecomicrobium hirschii]|uniref:cytochrome d ubiquinol oxidase subunit II n=1 Tax=Prosthecodimorpha hirschii TaxID=665126 RepID=UPI00221FFBF5|nr:cytochrome d ubiquinol oxidase subunit II [Prosthecomicrobium hirschii]MCW1841472.1 cytochrome d ubiquinol oxidase subunit II [Prosthecomicrobium hirschii]
MNIPVDYETLRLIWWLFLGILLIGFAIMDGFDLGAATLLRTVARTDNERRQVLNAIGPVWEGNQVWLILGGGAIFAAWPAVYATAFSGFYIAMFLVLATLILRPVGFEYRNKIADPRWRASWDWALFAGGLVPSLVFGVAIGNLLQGVPFRIDNDMRVLYEGSGLFELLNPFGLLCGLVSLAMLTGHGVVFVALKTEGPVADRARVAGALFPGLHVLLFTLAGLWIAKGLPGYALVGAVAHDGPSNPLVKEVAIVPGQWLKNYEAWPLLKAAPIAGLAGSVLTAVLVVVKRPGFAFVTSAIAIFGTISTVGVSMFPFLMPSSIAPGASLTVWDSSSSQLTLFVMLCATLLFLPIVLVYTAFVFRVLRGKMTAEAIEANSTHLY